MIAVPVRLLFCVAAAGLLSATPAGAQEDVVGEVDISFDVGEYDADLEDWTIDVVEVTGDLEDGADFTVELFGDDDAVLWSATTTHTAPETRIELDERVAVSDVRSAGVSQPQTVVGGVQVDRPEVTWSAGGGGGSGQLALSMVLAIIIVAVIFRTPLPSSSTQRWTK